MLYVWPFFIFQMSYQSSELYPQQILPVNTSVAEGYNLPTPPHSPLQITDLSVMTGHRHYSMEPVQSMPTDLSMHDHLENCKYYICVHQGVDLRIPPPSTYPRVPFFRIRQIHTLVLLIAKLQQHKRESLSKLRPDSPNFLPIFSF